MKKWEGYIKGVNLGGWLSQFAKYDEKHFAEFITESDIENIASMGFDHVRIPVDFVMLESDDEEGRRNPLGYEYIHKAINWCRKSGLNIVLDIHEVYGYSFDPLKDMDRERFFYDKALQTRYHKLWRSIAKEFAADTDIVAFELLNEVVLSDVYEAWNKVAHDTIEVIREEAKEAWIVVGGVRYNNVNSVELLDKPYDDRIIYNFHCYEPLVFTHQRAYWVDGMPSDFTMKYPASLEDFRAASDMFSKDLVGEIYDEAIPSIGVDFFRAIFKPAVEAAAKYDVPLYCGEYGVIDKAPAEDSLRWFKDIHEVFEENGIGRAVWNYKEKDFGLMDKRLDGVRKELVKYC